MCKNALIACSSIVGRNRVATAEVRVGRAFAEGVLLPSVLLAADTTDEEPSLKVLRFWETI